MNLIVTSSLNWHVVGLFCSLVLIAASGAFISQRVDIKEYERDLVDTEITIWIIIFIGLKQIYDYDIYSNMNVVQGALKKC